MIGPITFRIRPPGAPAPGPVTIFVNFAMQTPKIAIKNSGGYNVRVQWQDKSGKITQDVLPTALQAGDTSVFNILPDWMWILVDVYNPADHSSIEVSYE
jgi:hypothetical protein